MVASGVQATGMGRDGSMTEPRKPLVLVADDDEDILALVTFGLESEGYSVVNAADGQEAFDVACQHLPDLAVLDVSMPRADGFEVTRMLRRHEETRRIPVILLTARVTDGDIATGFEAGAEDYLKKPFSPQELQTRVRAILGRTAQHGSLERRQQETEKEIERAAAIQRGLLPDFPLAVCGAAVAGRCFPAANVGGDCFDYVADDKGRLVVFIADVAGHSIGSALLMAMARSTVRREMAAGVSPADVLATANRVMFDDLVTAELFITMFCVRYDPAGQTLVYANAGHNLPLLQTGGRVLGLDADGAAIGILRDVAFEELEAGMTAGDRLLLYTDGAMEALDGNGAQFGEERLRALLREARGAPPELFVEHVYAAVGAHTGNLPQQDDITLVAVQATDR